MNARFSPIISGDARASRIEFANVLRGLAALSVVIAHLVTAFWLGQPIVATLTGIPALTLDPPLFAVALDRVPINFASFGVGLFFVISGFVIPFSLTRYDARAFLIGRAFRIYPTYWIGFTITALSISAGAAWFGGALTFNLDQLIQHYFPPLRALLYSKPIDGIIWTLEIELFFYLLCAALAKRIKYGDWRVALAPIGIFIVWLALYLFLSHTGPDWARIKGRLEFIIIYLPFLVFMFCGMALNFLQRRLIKPFSAAVWVSLCFFLFLCAWSTGRFVGVIEPWSYAAALALFILCMACQRWFRPNRAFQFLADISYPLYVVHGVAGYAMLQMLALSHVGPWMALTITLAVVLLIAWCIHIFIEQPSHRLGQSFARNFMQAKTEGDRPRLS